MTATLCLFSVLAGFLIVMNRSLSPVTAACDTALGMQSGWIVDSDITATSFLTLDNEPGSARLNSTKAWSPVRQDVSEILQIHLETEANVSAIGVQGNPTADQWITKFRVEYSMDGMKWQKYPEVLNGNTDRNTIVRATLSTVLQLNYLRIKPVEWENAIALRLEIYGCMKEKYSCGKRPLYQTARQQRIIQGTNAQPYTWPWQVEVTINNTKHWCGASLIDPHWIITAGHCVHVYSPASTGTRILRLAEYNRLVPEGYEKYVVPDKIYLHPGFVIGDIKSPGYYDIALMHLKESLTFTDRIQPVCLPDENTRFDIGTVCTVSGWGKTSSGENGTYAKTLQQLQVPLVSKEVCNSNVSYNGVIPEQFLCAGYKSGGRDSCYGDSGGPLVCQTSGGEWILHGLVSWGEECAMPNKYGVYTDVRKQLPFIESVLYGYPKCGVRFLPEGGHSRQKRIVGGRESKPNSWPWQVDILTTVNKTEHYCGGSLLNPSWVLTSAHCFHFFKNISQFEIRLGEHDERKVEGYEEVIPGKEYHIHPDFKLGDMKYPGHFDVALIKLKRPAVFHKRVHSICLPDVNFNITTVSGCYVTGWGKTGENNKQYSPVLNELPLNIVPKQVCNSNISYNGTIPDEYFCAGFPGGGKDSCFGDSGGPLACPNKDGQYVLTGVVSWGIGCARPYKYGVYLDVRKILGFINSKINASANKLA